MDKSAYIIQKAYRNTDICAICLTLVVKNNNNCHSFHNKCIKLYKNYNCPICKKRKINIDFDYNTIKSFLIIVKRKLKYYNNHRTFILNKYVFNNIINEAHNLNMNVKEYYIMQSNNYNKILKHYFREKLLEFIKNNNFRNIIENECSNIYYKINYAKETIKMCKIILCEYNDIKTGKLNEAIQFINTLLIE